jgi:hypothetical protein
MTFKAPVNYRYSLPEVLAELPGDAFGRRDVPWGTWM